MFFKRTIKRFAHVNGYTFVTYSENGEIISTGTDGDLRIWKEISDDDPTSQCIGENGRCCVQYTTDQNNKRLLATTGNTVQAYKYPDFDRDGVEFRFSAPVTSISVNKKYMAAASEDSSIKVQKLDKSDDIFEFKAEGPVLHIELNNNNQLVSSSGDGIIRIWNLETQKVLKTFDGLEKFTKFSDVKKYCTPVFEKTGRYLAFSNGKQIHVVETTIWEIKFKLENNEISGSYTACCFSHCGLFLASGTTKGEISIWSLADNSKISGEYVVDEDYAITSIEWNPTSNEIAFCDFDGQLSTVKLKTSGKNATKDDEDIKGSNAEEDTNDPDDIYGGIDFHDDGEDDDNENCVALDKLKNETMRNVVETDDDDDDDAKTVKSQQMSIQGSERFSSFKPFQVQLPFQPGSTPEHLEHRFMVWNHVGQVLCHSSTDENSIIVEFHDATLHPSLHILNQLNHSMASLSTTCLALATKDSPCKLVCIALLSSGNKEWSTTMPDCEEIQAIAAGNSFVAIATDAGYIRLLTTMGTQREILMPPGPIVCLSAYENKLIAAYHTSNTCNKYSIMIITIMGLTSSNRTVDIPLAKNTKLNWLGFSDCGSIIAYESSGRLISYNIKRNLWMPICDTSNHVIGGSDTFFIIGVSERSQKIRATLCRGTNYPLTNPRPIMREIDYCLPMCYMETEKSKLEEALTRSVNFEIDSSCKSLVENGLKLFSTAMNAELESRAFEIVELIGDRKLIELSSKYASQKGRLHMAGKISNLLHDFDEKVNIKKTIIESIERDAESFTEMYEKEEMKADEIRREKTLRETSTPLIAPRPMISQRKGANPFKKSANTSIPTTKNALNHLTKKSIGYNDSTINSSGVTHSDEENNLSKINRSTSADTPRPGNFSQWYIANQSSLQNDNPDVSKEELIKIGKSLYKDLTQKTKSFDESNDSAASISLNKRKLDMNEDVGGIAKLAKYGFTEK